MGTGGGLIGLLLLIAMVWSIVNVAQSAATVRAKTVWIVMLLILPVIGFIAWLFMGPRAGKAQAGA